MWSRRSWRSELEAGLRGRRAEVSADLVEGIARRIGTEQVSRRRAGSRIAFAAAVSVFMLGTFASFGGLSYAAAGADGTVAAVKQIVVNQALRVRIHESSAASQYPRTPSKPAKPHKPFTPPKVLGKTVNVKTPAAVVSATTLPFTGFSLLGTFVLSLLLIGVGVALRRREHRKN